MLVKFVNRALDTLDRLYGFVGGVSRVDQLDLGPISLVHDVSSEAELNVGFVAPVAITLASGGASTRAYSETLRSAIFSNNNIAANLQAKGLEVADVDVWVVAVSALVSAATAGNFANAWAAVVIGNIVGSGTQYVLSAWDTLGEDMVSAGPPSLQQYARAMDNAPLPILVTDDETSAFRIAVESGAGGSCTCTLTFLCWFMPKGSRPPRA